MECIGRLLQQGGPKDVQNDTLQVQCCLSACIDPVTLLSRKPARRPACTSLGIRASDQKRVLVGSKEKGRQSHRLSLQVNSGKKGISVSSRGWEPDLPLDWALAQPRQVSWR